MTDLERTLEAERRIINAAKRHCDLPLTFQQWGEQNQNGDYAESILFDANGESLADGLPDEIGYLAEHSSTALPLRNAQVAKVLHECGEMEWWAQNCFDVGKDAEGKQWIRAAKAIRRAIEEAGA